MGRRSQAGLSDFTGGYDTLAGIGRDDAVERFDSSVLEYIEEGPGGGELPFGDSAEGFVAHSRWEAVMRPPPVPASWCW